MLRSFVIALLVSGLSFTTAFAQNIDSAQLNQILQRLDTLEQQNARLTAEVAALREERQAAQPITPAPAPAPAPAQVAKANPSANEWASRIQFKGDFRYRHDRVDSEGTADHRVRDTLRARFGAQIKVNDEITGEIALASGGPDPRGASAILGSAQSRKDFELDLAYMSWRAFEGGVLTAGKMRQPYVRTTLDSFIDNELRPEGLAFTYSRPSGLYSSAFYFWQEERATEGDSKVTGGQLGWKGAVSAVQLNAGLSYFDYSRVQGQLTNFGGGLVGALGNTVIGTGTNARYAYDYDIAEAFAETTFDLGALPLSVFANYGRNTAADDGLDTAWRAGVLLGKANQPGRWEVGTFTQRIEKDALFGQWIDSDFAGGVSDNDGQVYRLAWMAMPNLLINATYIDTRYNVELDPTDYDRLQLDFNFSF